MRDDTVNDGLVKKPIKRVVYRVGRGRQVDTGWVLDFGARDWTGIDMALREIVANAIDRTIREKTDFLPALSNGDLAVKVVEENQVRAKDSYTRVFVQVNDDVLRFYGELPRRFLHFSDQPSLVKERFLPKADRNLSGKKTAMIYKQGVFVREISEEDASSIYDYNLGDELRIDESRNSSEWEIKAAVGRLYRHAPSDKLVAVFQALLRQESCWEAGISNHDLAVNWGTPAEEQKQAWQQAWEIAAGPDAVMCDAALAHLADFIGRKGFNAKPISAIDWVTAAARVGIKTAGSVLDASEADGKQVIPAALGAIEAVNMVWSWVESKGLTNGKLRPNVACFRSIMQASCDVQGYYVKDTVYLREDLATAVTPFLLQVALEEVAHHITGSGDMSRDIQDFGFRVAVAMA